MNELRHYGVKGMKWGVRRYQNGGGNKRRKSPYKKRRISASLRNFSREYLKALNLFTLTKTWSEYALRYGAKGNAFSSYYMGKTYADLVEQQQEAIEDLFDK